MLLIRNLAYWLVMCLTTVLFALTFFLFAWLPASKRHLIGIGYAKSLVRLLELLIGLKYTIVGAENVPTEPAIICCKHQSAWETLALQIAFPAQVFVCKRELFWIPVFGWGLRLMSPIAIDRKDRAKATRQILEQGTQRKKQGFWISIFPEGTRVPPGVRGRYKLGAARMAKTLEMDIVPVAVNSGEFWPRNSFMKHPGLITMVIGKPIPHTLGGAEVLMHKCEEWIENRQSDISGVGPCAHPDDKARAANRHEPR